MANRSTTRRKNDELEKSYRRVSSGGKYQKKRSKKKKSPAASVLFIALLVIVAVIAGSLYIYNSQNSIIANGITVAGVDIGGMTQAEAISAVAAATEGTYALTPMIVKVLDSQVTILPSVSKASLNVRSAVKAAVKKGTSPGAVDISPYLNLDEAAIRETLDALGAKYSSTLSQSTFEVTGTAPEQVLVVKLGVPEYGLDMNRLYQDVLNAYSANTFTVEGVCEMIKPKPIDLAAILNQHYIAPKDAYFDKDSGKLIDSVDGYGFDINKAEKTLQDAAYGSTIKIPFTNISPAITTETLVASLYQDTLGTYTATEPTSDTDRNTNLSLACQAINGMVINPGEIFSYNTALGERTAERGYRPGPSFSGGKTVKTIGGGICQVSSALYYCAMMADMEITTRDNHGFAVSYVPLGMDAAVSWGSLDFCFKNNTNFPIRIDAKAEGGTTTVALMGTDQKDYYVELRYEVLATYSYDTIYENHAPDNAQGYKQGDVIMEPHTGYSIQTYRCKYDKETKELIEDKKEAASYYGKSDKVVCQISGSFESGSQGIGNGGVTESDGLLP